MATGELTHKRVAFYGRFSSEMQNESSVDDQLRVCRSYVERRGGIVDANLMFSDLAVSGSIERRPGLIALRAAVKSRAMDVLVVEDLSRLSRSSVDTPALLALFDFNDVRLLGVSDGVDTSMAQSEVHTMIHGYMAQQYVKALGERTLRGMEGRFLAGGSTGGVPFGYQSKRAHEDAPAIVSIHPAHADVVRRIFALYTQGHSPATIVGRLNGDGAPTPRRRRSIRADGWIYSAVREILLNPKYIGEWSFKARSWKRDPETRRKKERARPEHQILREQREHLRIIDESTWAVVQERFASNKVPARAAQHANYLLTGLVFCGECGGRMSVIGGKTRRYGCSAYHRSRLCQNKKSVREDVTRQRVLEVFRDRFFSPSALRFARQCYVEEMRALDGDRSTTLDATERKQRALRDQVANLVKALGHGASSALAAELHRVERELKALDVEAAAALHMQNHPPRIPSDAELIERVMAIESRAESDPHTAREALKAWLGPEGIRLDWTGTSYVARFEVFPMTILLQNIQPPTIPKNDGRPVYTNMVAGAQYAGGIHRIGPAIACEVSLAG